MEIRIVRGPLPTALLQAIASLYGRVDAKYSSPDYCRYLFNANPFGYSIHAFAYEDETPVGHISLIPMWIDTPRGSRISYKAEAFYVPEEHRDAWVEVEDDELPLGLALPKVLYASVFREEAAVIHLLADDGIGKIHRYAGCVPVTVMARERFLILDPGVYLSREASMPRRLLIRLAHLYQSLLGAVCCRTWRSKYQVDNTLSEDFAGIPSTRGSGWTVSMDKGYREWLLGSPFIRVYSVDKQACCVVKLSEYPGRNCEILSWVCQAGARRRFSAILQKVIADAKARKASAVVARSFSQSGLPKELESLLFQAGFLVKSTPLRCFIRADDPYYLDPQNLSYSPFFYSQF